MFEVRFYREGARSATVEPTTMTPQAENLLDALHRPEPFLGALSAHSLRVALMFTLGALIIQSLGDPPLPPQRGELTGQCTCCRSFRRRSWPSS